jgi:transglutaminase-like putative cysteine protease
LGFVPLRCFAAGGAAFRDNWFDQSRKAWYKSRLNDMRLILSAEPAAYLAPAELVDSAAPEIAAFVRDRLTGCDDVEAARRVFLYVRDEVSHSYDIQGRRVTRSATDALEFKEGICYPKSHLVAALLRNRGIPAAMCYQRLTLFDDDQAGYALHALNAVYLEGGWHRIDARGNKPGVDAQFSLEREQLAFPIRLEYDEVDYPTLYAEPHPSIVDTLISNDDAMTMYRNLPDRL